LDLFGLIFNALSPYLFAIARLAFAITLFSCGIKYMRARTGGGIGSGGNGMQGSITAFVGYLFCRGIPVIISITDSICNEVMKNMGG